MKIHSLCAAANIGCTLLILGSIAAQAAEVSVLSSGGMRSIMEDLGPRFENRTGHKLSITFANTVAATKRIDGGEIFDVVIIPQSLIDRFVKAGKVGNVTAVASSGMGVAVRRGAPCPISRRPRA